MNIPNPFKQKEHTQEDIDRKKAEEYELENKRQEEKARFEMQQQEKQRNKEQLNKIYEHNLHQQRIENAKYKAHQQASKERQFGTGVAGKVNQTIFGAADTYKKISSMKSHGVRPRPPRTYASSQQNARTVTMQPPAITNNLYMTPTSHKVIQEPLKTNPTKSKKTKNNYSHLFDIKNNNFTPHTNTRDFGDLFNLRRTKKRW